MKAPRTILLVDDDEPVREVVRTTLERAGHQVESVGDGAAASRVLELRAFDVLVTDLLMPERDGIELIREVRRRYPRLGIVAISGGGRIHGAEYLSMAKGMGAGVVLQKPFLPEEVCAAVERVYQPPSPLG